MSDILSVEEAVARLLTGARAPTRTETLPSEACLGRVLARDLVSSVTVPPFDNAAMDGYALRAADWNEATPSATFIPTHFPISQRIPAGSLPSALVPGTAARIFTGAPIPPGADAVVMQEDCESQDGEVRFLRPPRTGDHLRRAGEDIHPGQTVLTAGTRLGPAQLGVAASVGADRLEVHARLKAAVFFTGDEIVMPGQPLPQGRIYNSNRASLLALLGQLGVEVVDLGQVRDSLDATVAVLEQASRAADVVITTGGVSVGEEDHVKAALERLGRLDMWKVNMKPGKPLAFGRVGEADFLGLPGNPVSAFVVFCLFARPFLLARMGSCHHAPLCLNVPAGFSRKGKPGQRREFLRVQLVQDQLQPFPNQSSGVLTSLSWADGLADVAGGVAVNPGDPVRFIPMTELLR